MLSKYPEWSELVRLVNDVRKDIPQIPEIKSYDDELEGICSQIEQIQTNFSLLDAKSDKITDLSSQNEEFEVKLTEIESKIPEVPEVRYYEGIFGSFMTKFPELRMILTTSQR